MSEKTAYACPRCQIGHLHQSRATFSALYQGMLFTLPDAEAWMCDICQYREFDASLLDQIDILIAQPGAPNDVGRTTPRSSGHDSAELNNTQRLKP